MATSIGHSETSDRAIPRRLESTKSTAIAAPESLLDGTRSADRVVWLDTLKVCAILGVIGIHVTADSAGLPYSSFAPEDRLGPALGRAVATYFNYPVFFITSLFLLAGSSRYEHGYAAVTKARLKRLVPPYLAWSVFYLAFRNVKAISFGYQDYYWQELTTPISWLQYGLIGGAQYHLHFLPTLMALTLLYPLYKSASRWPILGLALVGSLFLWPSMDSFVYAQLGQRPDLIPIALSGTKLIAFSGYGFLGFALYAIHRDMRERDGSSGISWLRWLLGVLAVFIATAAGFVLYGDAVSTARAGQWLARDFTGHLAYYLAPISIVLGFIAARNVHLGSLWTRLGSHAFGVYLFHPVVLDLLEITEMGWNLSPSLTASFNFGAVTILSFLVVMSASGVPGLRILFGHARVSR
jgi:surface polysaccharide O-acyltransferase-like enzyme